MLPPECSNFLFEYVKFLLLGRFLIAYLKKYTVKFYLLITSTFILFSIQCKNKCALGKTVYQQRHCKQTQHMEGSLC